MMWVGGRPPLPVGRRSAPPQHCLCRKSPVFCGAVVPTAGCPVRIGRSQAVGRHISSKNRVKAPDAGFTIHQSQRTLLERHYSGTNIFLRRV